MSRYTAKEILTRKQDGGCNGTGGRVRKVMVAWTVSETGRLVREWGVGKLAQAQVWADHLNEVRGL